MNKQRRARIQEVVDQIGVLCQELEELRDEEQGAVIKGLPTQLLYEELGIRLATQAEFIGKIVTTVQEAT